MTMHSQMDPIKTYNISRETRIHYRHLQVRQNNQTFLWVNTTGFKPKIHLQTQSEHGPVVATTSLNSFSRGCQVTLGGADANSRGVEVDVDSQGWSSSQYVFNFQGQPFIWRRTHNEALGVGAGSSRSTNFKLLDGQNEKVLGVYVQDWNLLDKTNVGTIHYFVDLEPNLELLSMAAIFGIEDKIRRRKNNSAAASIGATA